ncbi:MAG: molecular chaperone TorD family protein [Acidobacteriia bacterium]|nr:molecular chaperone TorD family protein [Terriglobia bacterium]
MSTADVAESPLRAFDWTDTDLYRLFAFLFAPPSPRCFQFLAQPETPAALRSLWELLECEGACPDFKWFSSYEEYESAYIALFDVGIPEPPVALFESAHDKTRPAQEIALENACFYEVLGLRSDPSQAVPDYLVTQLEFLAAVRYTAQHASEEDTRTSLARAEAEFLERHLLNWISGAHQKLARTGAPAFPLLLSLLVRFLKTRAEELTSPH